VDIIFTKVKAKSARKIKYDEYLSGLAQAAATLGITFEELAEKLTAKGPP
jgi:ATP-dependent protease HslVU (ClpYQ) peptidase subunit